MFLAILVSGKVEPLALHARSANLNAYAERWVRSVNEECSSKVILFGERSLRRALVVIDRAGIRRFQKFGHVDDLSLGSIIGALLSESIVTSDNQTTRSGGCGNRDA